MTKYSDLRDFAGTRAKLETLKITAGEGETYGPSFLDHFEDQGQEIQVASRALLTLQPNAIPASKTQAVYALLFGEFRTANALETATDMVGEHMIIIEKVALLLVSHGRCKTLSSSPSRRPGWSITTGTNPRPPEKRTEPTGNRLLTFYQSFLLTGNATSRILRP